jgi:Zn-finger protein
MEEVTPEVVHEVVHEVIPETKAMDWTTVMNIQSVSTKQFLDNIMISNIDIINLIKDYTLDEKIIELIKEEYDGCGINKPFYTCNHKKQILFIKTRQDWIKHCVDDEGLIYGFIEDTLIKKITEKAKQKEMEINTIVNRDKLYEDILNIGLV